MQKQLEQLTCEVKRLTAVVSEFIVRQTSTNVPSTTHGETPIQECQGCEDFACVDAKSFMSMGEKELLCFFKRHNIIKKAECPIHGADQLSVVDLTATCVAATDGKKRCRKVFSVAGPLLSTKSKVSLHQIAMFLVCVSRGDSLGTIASQMELNKNSITTLFASLGEAAMRRNLEPRTFKTAQVDETCIGKRKENKGRRPRQTQQWFMTITGETFEDQTTQTRWMLVPDRTKPTIQKFLSIWTNGRSTVTTDSFKSYIDASLIVRRHNVVCHKKEFVTSNGHSTNKAEGAHGVVKTGVKRQCGRFGTTTEALQRNIAVQVAKFGGTCKLRNLLCCLKYWGGDVQYDTGKVAVVTEPILDKPVQVKLTNKGRPDKRCRSDDEDTVESPPRKKRPGHEALEVLREGTLIDAAAVVATMRAILPKEWVVVCPETDSTSEGMSQSVPQKWNDIVMPVFYSNHFVLLHAQRTRRVAFVYDSLRGYAHEERDRSLQRSCELIYRLTKFAITTQLKACEQQLGGSNDCGLFAVRFAARAAGCVEDINTISRRTLYEHYRASLL